MTAAPPGFAQALAGRYVLDRELGRGGMATVYLAQDTRHRRPVAVKVLEGDVAATVGAERFLREIGIIARLAHPHILPLLDSGEAAGRLFFVVPYIPGGTLLDRLEREHTLPVGEALRIVREVGAGLDYAHREGFIHRDVKPANILFVDGHAVLADFGVARVCCGPEMEQATEIGLVVGTPEYMSPEQASGENVDSRSDQYALACVLFEMLAGSRPLQGDTPHATMARQVTMVPVPLRSLRPDTPPAVERAVARALAKSPAERFSTVTEMLAALDETDAGGAPLLVERCIAVLPFVNASPEPENEYLSDGITDELIDALAKIAGLRVASRTSVFALKGRAQDVRAIGALLGAAWVLDGTVRRAGDRLRVTAQLSSTDDGRLLWSERFDRTFEDVFAIEEELARTIVDTLRATSFADLPAPAARRYTTSVAAYGLYLRGRHAWNRRTQAGVADAIGYFERAIAEDPAYAPAYTGLADSYALQLDYRSVPVAEGFVRAKEYARQALAIDDQLAEAHASLAWSLFIYDWDWAGAERSFRRAIELDPRYATAHQWYTFLLAAQGRNDESLAEAHTAQELDPASVSIRRAVAWAYYYARRYDRARNHASRAIAMNPAAEESHRILALAFAADGKFDDAVKVLRASTALADAGTYPRSILGYALARAGARDEATAILQSLEALARDSYVTPVAFATLHLGLGNWDDALIWAERALDERRGWLAYLKVHPMLDPVRSHPQFSGLLARAGL